ncbi:MAG: hypothetical protein ACM3X6_11155 [Patescibacteria group bacterium]
MKSINWERWGAATGYLVAVLGVAAASFERGAPPASAPGEEILAFLLKYRSELLAQSLLFVLSAGVYLWFFGSLRYYLAKGEAGSDRLATVAYGAGVIWAGLQMMLQSVQIALAMGSSVDTDPALAGMMGGLTYAISVTAYVPMGIMLAAVAAAAFRTGILPAWLGWFSTISSIANLCMVFGVVTNKGLLVPGGVFTYALYAMMPIWLLSVTTVLCMRLGKHASPKETSPGM